MPTRIEAGNDGASLDLLGKPLLPKGEDKAAYLKLMAQIQSELKPKTVLDAMRVYDLTNNIWEEQRFKRAQAALVDGALLPSLEFLLAPLTGHNYEEASTMAKDYFSGEKKLMQPVVDLMKQYGVTPEQIQAAAMHLRSNSLQSFDRMISNRAILRNRIIRDHERRQRKSEKAKRKSGLNDNHSGSEAKYKIPS